MFEDHEQPKPTAPPPNPPGGGLASRQNFSSMNLGGQVAEFEKPKSASAPVRAEAVIHTMPRDYYGVPPKTTVKKVVPTPPPHAAPKPAAPPPAAPAPTKKPKRKIPVILITGVVLLLVVGIGGFLLLRSVEEPAAPRVTQPTPPPPQPTPQPEPEPVPSPSPPAPEPIRSGIDTDSDGLTDTEERTIYGSDPRNPDTDGDSFIDGNEVLYLYDPTQQSPALIEEDGIFVTYHPFGGRWQILIPKGWKADPPDPFAVDELTYARIAAPSGEMIIFEFPEQGDGAEPQQFVSSDVRLLSFRSKSGLEGWRSVDQRLIIIRDGGIILIRYELGEKRSIDFLRTFEMMVNSYVLPIGGPIE